MPVPHEIVLRGIERHLADVESEARGGYNNALRSRVVRSAIREARQLGREADSLGPFYVLAALRELELELEG
jgi:hypothetical protein